MTYKYFFFDFDGMLCDSYTHTASAFVYTLKQTRNINIKLKEAYDLFKVSFKTAFDYYKVTEKEIELFTINHENIDFKPVATLYLPVEKLLNSIVKSGGKIFIYTNRNDTLFKYLDKFDIRKYFVDFITVANKPDPKPLLDMIEKYDLEKEQCVVVGDRAIDVDAAYYAGIDGILYDEDSRVFLHHATHVIKKINELYNFIDLPYTLKNNYHTHTTRCGHAVGSDEEYVISAIKAGYQTLGFSDHIMLPDLNRNYEYFDSIGLLKEKYKNQIDIKIALEVEYYEKYLPFYKKLKDEKLVDYLIFGNHGYLNANQVSRGEQICFLDKFDDSKYLDLYYECLKKAIETKLFTYIAHPDCFFKGYPYWNEHTIELAHKIGKLLKENDVYAELSGSGYRSRNKMIYNGEVLPCYPFKEFFRILASYDLKFVLGCDAHSPKQLDDEAVEYIRKMAEELNLNVIYEINDL